MSKFSLMAKSLGTNDVVVTRVHCTIFHRNSVVNANCVDPDQILGHLIWVCTISKITLLGVSRIEWVID